MKENGIVSFLILLVTLDGLALSTILLFLSLKGKWAAMLRLEFATPVIVTIMLLLAHVLFAVSSFNLKAS